MNQAPPGAASGSGISGILPGTIILGRTATTATTDMMCMTAMRDTIITTGKMANKLVQSGILGNKGKAVTEGTAAIWGTAAMWDTEAVDTEAAVTEVADTDEMPGTVDILDTPE